MLNYLVRRSTIPSPLFSPLSLLLRFCPGMPLIERLVQNQGLRRFPIARPTPSFKPH